MAQCITWPFLEFYLSLFSVILLFITFFVIIFFCFTFVYFVYYFLLFYCSYLKPMSLTFYFFSFYSPPCPTGRSEERVSISMIFNWYIRNEGGKILNWLVQLNRQGSRHSYTKHHISKCFIVNLIISKWPIGLLFYGWLVINLHVL